MPAAAAPLAPESEPCLLARRLGYPGLIPFVGCALTHVSCAVGRRASPMPGVAPWLTLRLRLIALAGLSCFISAAAS